MNSTYVYLKKCSKCKIYKFKNCFSKDIKNKDEKRNKCRSCESWRKRKNRYGLEKKEILDLVKDQNNRCLICNNDFLNREFHIDHCHTSGKIRGLLCGNCNTGIGLLNDDIQILNKAIEYLENFKKKEEKAGNEE